jgi:hypothetical protein
MPALEVRDGFGEPVARFLVAGGVEDGADDRAQQPVLIAPCVAETIPEEVHGAALPACPEHLGDCRLQPGVRVADGQPHSGQAASDQTPQEVGPEGLGLGLPDVQDQDLAAAGLVHAMRDDQRLGHDAATIADLLDLGIQEQVRVGALQRPGPKRLDLLIQPGADPADLRAADAQAQALHELIDAPRGDAADIGLLDHR